MVNGKVPMHILTAGKVEDQGEEVVNPDKRDDHLHLQVGTQLQAGRIEAEKGKVNVPEAILTMIRTGKVEKEIRMTIMKLPDAITNPKALVTTAGSRMERTGQAIMKSRHSLILTFGL